jgi:uncharacterized protein involved in exopolysaccharide biosynthesis
MENNNLTDNGSPNLSVVQAADLPQDNLLQIIVRHRWTILPTILFFLTAGFLYVMKAMPIYTSTSRLYVEQTGPKIITEYEGVMTRSKNYLYTQAGLIKSTPIVATVADDPVIKQFRMFAGVDNLMAYIKSSLRILLRLRLLQRLRLPSLLWLLRREGKEGSIRVRNPYSNK